MAVLSAVRAKGWLLHLQSSGKARGSVSFNVLREICPYFQDSHFFAAIYKRHMRLYDFNTRKTAKRTLPVDVVSGYIQVDRTTVLIVGKHVMTLDLLTFEITRLSPLLKPREFAGVAQMDNTVFAFGGSYPSMTVCEKSSVPPTHWTPLPPMHYARSWFTPCAFNALLYLAATYAEDHRAVESFSPHTETFTVLPVSLPQDLGIFGSSVTGQIGIYQYYFLSVAYMANGELLLLTDKKQLAG